MTEIYLVRHGEVDGNINKKYVGLSDYELNEKGKLQVVELTKRLFSNTFDIGYYSPLKRASQTFDIIEKANTIKTVFMCDGLMERNFGIFEDLDSKEVLKKYPNEYSKLCSDWENYTIPCGESAYQSYNRVLETFDKIVLENEGKKILIVSHSGCIKYILANKITATISGFWKFNIDNGRYSKLEKHEDFYVLSKING